MVSLRNSTDFVRSVRSTIDAIVRFRSLGEDGTGDGEVVLVVGLDVANIFNSFLWSVIRNALLEKGSPSICYAFCIVTWMTGVFVMSVEMALFTLRR